MRPPNGSTAGTTKFESHPRCRRIAAAFLKRSISIWFCDTPGASSLLNRRRCQIWARGIRIWNSKNVAIASRKSDDVRIVQAINFASNAILERRFFGDALESAVLPVKMKTNRMPRRFLNAKET